jgi:hypothetical protein
VFRLKATNVIPVYFIFVYGVLNDTLNSTNGTASNKEFGWTWKSAVLALFEVVSQHWPEGAEENHKNP